MPEPGREETVRVVALDKNFHMKCYKCEVGVPEAPELGGGGTSLTDQGVDSASLEIPAAVLRVTTGSAQACPAQMLQSLQKRGGCRFCGGH